MNQRADPSATETSKSQRKREAQAMFKLGRRLTDLPPARLADIPLDDDIREAIEFARSIRSHVARKRQLGFLARLLRLADTSAIEAALDRQQSEARELSSRHHRAEAWRDCLLEHGDAALAPLTAGRPDVDPQPIRQLLRNARREQERGKPPAAARKLFRLLRDLDTGQPLPPVPAADRKS